MLLVSPKPILREEKLRQAIKHKQLDGETG